MLGKEDRKTVVVIGSSKLGAAIASYNSKKGIYTVIIDKDSDAFKKLDPNFSGFMITGNAEERYILEKAHIETSKECDIVTDNDNTNIFIACLLVKFYQIPYIYVRLHDTTKSILLPKEVKIISPYLLSMNLYQSLKEDEK
ncbi:MAG: NAD-binding protein [Bacilli bacterium]|jgi:trk system potassium uptake protein TrkA